MKRSVLLGMLIFAVGCAHQSRQQVSTVHVVVTASPDAARQFGASVFERITESELRGASAVTPRPLTLTVHMDATDQLLFTSARPTLKSGREIAWATIFDGLVQPVVAGADRRSFAPPRRIEIRNEYGGTPVVVGSYTISDEAGAVREQQPIVMVGAPYERGGTRTQLQSMRAAAQYLAKRVVSVEQ